MLIWQFIPQRMDDRIGMWTAGMFKDTAAKKKFSWLVALRRTGDKLQVPSGPFLFRHAGPISLITPSLTICE